MRRGLAYAALGVVLLLAPACQGDPEPQFAPPESPSPSSTPPEPTPSDEPEALSPAETVRAWVDACNAALQDGNTRKVTQLMSDGCETCAALVDDIPTIYSNGGRITTEGWTILDLSVSQTSGKSASVRVQVGMGAGTTIPSAGASPFQYEAKERRLLFRLTNSGDSWVVGFLGYLS